MLVTSECLFQQYRQEVTTWTTTTAVRIDGRGQTEVTTECTERRQIWLTFLEWTNKSLGKTKVHFYLAERNQTT